MALRASDAVDGGVTGLRLRHERLHLVEKLVHMRRMAFEAESFVLAPGKRHVFIQGGSERR
jgi:hypothetical protein